MKKSVKVYSKPLKAARNDGKAAPVHGGVQEAGRAGGVARRQRGGSAPEVFNTDQGAQFTSLAFTERVLACGARCSMDGRGRCLDNVFIERLWRSMKYEAM